VQQGYTGSGIGLHGPRRGYTWLGRLNARVDWTRGCIALASDREIDALARWVRMRPGSFVVVR
jgi:murein L,D-transpeptidase YafK